MAEAIGTVLAVVPLVIEACKAYKTLYENFRIFRHYSKELKRILRKVNIQRGIFDLECRQLLHEVIEDEDDIERILNNGSIRLGDDLETRLQNHLGPKYNDFLDILEEVKLTIEELGSELKVVERISLRRQKGEQLKDTVSRIDNRFKLAFGKKKYEGQIKELVDFNSDLRILKSQAEKWRLPAIKAHQKRYVMPKRTPLPDFDTINQVSNNFYQIFTSWKCSDSTHIGHSVKLCLEAQNVQEMVFLEVVFSLISAQKNTMLLQPVRHLAVEVQKEDSDTTATRPRVCFAQAPQERPLDLAPASPLAGLLTLPSTIRSIESDDSKIENRKRVRFSVEEDPDLRARIDRNAACALEHGGPQPNSASTDCLCERLFNGVCSHKSASASCPGLYETCQGHYKHRFHSSTDCLTTPYLESLTLPATQTVSLRDMFMKPRDQVIGMSEQFHLARRIVLGVLQYHSTYWLSDQWTSTDLLMFIDAMDVSERSIKTLHVAKELPPIRMKKTILENSDSSMEGVERRYIPSTITRHTTTEDATLLYGIANMTLYSLGVTLLEIGYWAPLNAGDVGSIRKLLNHNKARFPLSLRYRELVRKCLECDFGFGNDLKEEGLQHAILSNVVNELDDLIQLTSKLDIKED